ncbi:MAG: DUF192 domain-containing protein [Bacillota bacterium]|nr:DUF192 domain-containing protein [Bacillota bacterium]
MLKIVTNNEEICKSLIVADSFFKRLKGLMFTKELPPDSSMYINPCGQIHTFFMNYDIDVLYLDKNNVILDIDESIKPGKIGKKVKGAAAVIELQGGKIRKSNIKIGQAIEIT